MTGKPDPLDRLLAGEIPSLLVTAAGQWIPTPRVTGLVLPGSFNPLHLGHLELARVSQELTWEPLTFELAVRNVDKPPLARATVEQRLQQFTGRLPVAITLAPTFREKADLFPGCAFVIGVDTAVRLVHPRYYGNSEAAMIAALEQIRDRGCHFLVAGRLVDQRFQTLEDISVPASLSGLFQVIPEELFRQDISSTEIRAAAGGGYGDQKVG